MIFSNISFLQKFMSLDTLEHQLKLISQFSSSFWVKLTNVGEGSKKWFQENIQNI